MLKEIRAGIIGFGFMGKAHTYGYKTMPLYYSNLPFKIRLLGVCAAHEHTAIAAKEYNGFEFATTNPDDILTHKDIDVVNICTPNIYHKECVIKAINAGKHVYCEKPLAVSFDEAKEIVGTLEGKNLVNQIVFHNRFFPATIKAKRIIDEGRIGRILSFRALYLHSGLVDPSKPAGWRQQKDIGGGGVLFDLGSHVIDLIYYLVGEYSSIIAKTGVVHPERVDNKGNKVRIELDDYALMIASMKCGATGTIEVSKIATGTNDDLRFEIHGEKGALRFNLMEPNYLDYYDNTLPEQPLGGMRGFTRIECVQRYEKPGGDFVAPKAPIGWIRAHAHCLYNFISCVYEGRQAKPSFKDGAYVQYVMEKAYESDKMNRWVDLQ